MKKIYFTIALLVIGLTGFAQAPEFVIDFESGWSFPSGVTAVDAPTTGTIQIKDIVTNVNTDVSQVVNEVITEGATGDVYSMDYQGHLIFDETAIGTSSFSIAFNYDGYGNKAQWCGFISLAGNDGGTWKRYALAHQYANGQMNGLGMSQGGLFDCRTHAYNHAILTFDNTTGLYQLYKDGTLVATSGDNSKSIATFTSRKLYLGYKGGTIAGDGTLPPAYTGDGTAADQQARVDNVVVYQRVISGAEAATLAANPTLGVNSELVQASFSAYPNPVKNRLQFSSNNVHSVDIYNLLGAKISSQTVENGVDVSNLSKGVYLVKCQDISGQGITVIKVIKE